MRRETQVDLTVEEWFDRINAEGWLVSSLYQRAPTQWVCSLRPDGDWSDCNGHGSTAATALADAFNQIDDHMSERDWRAVKKNGSIKKSIERVRPKATAIPRLKPRQ